MHDFDYDVMQKKRVARGAASRKRGSKSKKCSLPSDYMTQAQWKRRNGEMVNYNLNAPMSWSVFKAAPADLQQEYIQKLVNRYHVNIKIIADMFGVHPTTLSRLFRDNGTAVEFRKGKQMTPEDKARFAEFLTGESEDALTTAGPIPLIVPQDHNTTTLLHSEDISDAPDAPFQFHHLNFSFDAALDSMEIYNMLNKIIPKELSKQRVSVTINISMI